MRKVLWLMLTLLAGVSMNLKAQSQSSSSAPSNPGTTDLYVSKQTGEYSIYAGSGSKTTDKYENGSVSVSTSGPVQYSVTPNDMSIGTNESKTWSGMVWGDVAAAPTPGSSAPASITGTYTVTFSRPSATAPTGHEIVNKTGTETLNFNVHSLNVTTVDSMKICRNVNKDLYAQGYPDGGTYSWTTTGNVTIVAGGNTQTPTIKAERVGQGTATVTYTIGKVNYRATTQITCMNPSLIVPDTLRVGLNERFSINPRLSPSGSVQWSVSSGLQLNSGPNNFVAFITANQGGWQSATARATVCGQTITKTVRVYVNPCMLHAPDSVVILANTDATITASANVNGSFSWTAGNNVQVQSGGATATVTIRGTAATRNGWAEVAFSNASCNLTKRIKVIVLQRPMVRIYASFGNLSRMCKGERRIVNAEGLPDGGSYSWSLSSNSLTWYGPAGNSRTVVVEAARGGNCTITCTYTVNGQTATATADVRVDEYSRIDITANPAGDEVNQGTRVTYTAKVYDYAGQEVNPPPTLHWKVVYIPLGQEQSVGNWVSYDLQGGGASQNYTWSFPQGNFPLPAGGPPYKMSAWIEASEYCTYRSGSVHIKVVRRANPDGR